jgi:hypothetical protein
MFAYKIIEARRDDEHNIEIQSEFHFVAKREFLIPFRFREYVNDCRIIFIVLCITYSACFFRETYTFAHSKRPLRGLL